MQSNEKKSASDKSEVSNAVPYTMRISRLTIDKLGVKLYDKVSAVVAELIANSFDADAEKVTIILPLGVALATKRKDGIDEKGYTIEIEDDGHGMTPKEAQEFYLVVGKDRRKDTKRGGKSRYKKRPVMGRKGIGKLAPFGVCKRIEVISAGGQEVEGKGYFVSHFILKYDDIVRDSEEIVPLESGEFDKTYKPKSGTIIRLTDFAVKNVPNRDVFHRQLATRFVFTRPDFQVFIKDSITSIVEPVEPSEIKTFPETKIDLSNRPVELEDGSILPVKGWLAMAIESHKNVELAGVRIYAREKIVGHTRDFEQPAGFTGEFTVRSYLVGVIEADWLDLDEGEDLVRSDRQGILWDSEYGQAFKKWGAKLIREIGNISKEPRRKKKKNIFMERSNFVEKARERFPNESIARVAIDLAEQIGAFSAEDELKDEGYLNDLSEVILMVAPHKALINAFQEFNKVRVDGEESVENLVDLFDKTRIAEMASYAIIAAERVDAIKKLQHIVITEPVEAKFQELLADAPWLIEPTWSVVSETVALSTIKVLLEKHIKKELKVDIVFAVGFEDFSRKIPDFTLASIDGKLHIVEIKPSGHEFHDKDFERLGNYPIAFEEFFAANESVRMAFPRGWQITLIADGENLTASNNRLGFRGLVNDGKVVPITWTDFLLRAKKAHEEFLNVAKTNKKTT